MQATVTQKGNGYIVDSTDADGTMREILIEGKDPKKIGNAVLSVLKAPRKGKKKGEAT
jgi:hypothetical protein